MTSLQFIKEQLKDLAQQVEALELKEIKPVKQDSLRVQKIKQRALKQFQPKIKRHVQ